MFVKGKWTLILDKQVHLSLCYTVIEGCSRLFTTSSSNQAFARAGTLSPNSVAKTNLMRSLGG